VIFLDNHNEIERDDPVSHIDLSPLMISDTCDRDFIRSIILSVSTNFREYLYHTDSIARESRNPDHRRYSTTININTRSILLVFIMILIVLLTV